MSRILIIEDEEAIADLEKDYLELSGFEVEIENLHMIVPAYANSTQDNEYMTGEQSYHYYNEFLWTDRYADCVPMDKALELLKK